MKEILRDDRGSVSAYSLFSQTSQFVHPVYTSCLPTSPLPILAYSPSSSSRFENV